MIFDESYGNITESLKWENIQIENTIHIVPVVQIDNQWEPMPPHEPSENCVCHPRVVFGIDEPDPLMYVLHNVLN